LSIVLLADSISHSFGRKRVLSSATLSAPAATTTVVFGRNGSGKTTLLRVAAGLQRPDSGAVTFNGVRHDPARLHELATLGLFFLPERGLLMRNRTVREHFELVESRFGIMESGAAEMLGIESLLDRRPDTLSGGERRRAEVALALTRNPACLLADEPFMGVAPLDAEVLATAFRTLSARGCALVITGHEAATLLDLADNICWMTAGTTHSLGNGDAAREHWQFRREYLGT
jgi:lipopolysaccharide export system ATP-binding protein